MSSGWGVGQIRMGGSALAIALSLPGFTSNYVSTPDSAANSVTGDIDIRVRVKTPATPPGAPEFFWALMSKWILPPNRSFMFGIKSGSTLALYVSTDGTDNPSIDSPPITLPSASPLWLRSTRVAATGVVAFYVNGAYVGGGTIAAGSIYNSMAPLAIGATESLGASGMLEGEIYQAELRNGIGGTVVQSFDAAAVTKLGTRDPSTVAAGGPWTINGADWDWVT